MDAEVNLDDIHAALMDIMQIIHGFCIEHDIKYSLTGGSLLGAVRHNGFIPWDDDADLMFDRKNYEKFLKEFSQNGPEGVILERDQWVYRVRKEHRIKGYVPSVDLFVLDRVPKNKLIHKFQILRLKILQGMLRNNEKRGSYSPFYQLCIWITGIMGAAFCKEKLFRTYDRISQIGNKDASGQTALFNDQFRLITLKYSDRLLSDYRYHSFEDKEFLITENYEEFLTTQYGDYMKLPPIGERIPQHM